jgi:hypothetical protein
MHVIRRLYGDENRAVRAELDRIVERIPRYKTGIPANLDHEVPYINHPYARWQWKRALQEDSSATSNTTTPTDDATGGTATITTNATNLFKPMRIKYFTEALESIRDDTNGDKIDWYINTIMPITTQFWSNALSVVPVSGNLKISSSELVCK